MKFFTLFSIHFNYLFFLPAFEILLAFVINGCISLQTTCLHSSEYVKIIAIVGIFLLLGYSLFCILIAEHTFKFYGDGMQRMKSSAFIAFLRFSRILLPILYFIDPSDV